MQRGLLATCSRKEVRSRSHGTSAPSWDHAHLQQGIPWPLADVELLFHSPVGKHWVGDWHWSALRCFTKHHFMLLLVRHTMTSLLFARGCRGRRCALRCTGRFNTRVLLY